MKVSLFYLCLLLCACQKLLCACQKIKMPGWQGGGHDAIYLQYKPIELTFSSTQQYLNPFDANEVDFSAKFTGPNSQSINVIGFWDGDNTWKIRFSAPLPGLWSYTTRCTNDNDDGLDGKSGSFNVLSANSDNPIYAHGGQLKINED